MASLSDSPKRLFALAALISMFASQNQSCSSTDSPSAGSEDVAIDGTQTGGVTGAVTSMTSTGGTSASSTRNATTGGATQTGGSAASLTTAATGGNSSDQSSSTAASPTGGTPATGGTLATGGTPATGGTLATGGTPATGGITAANAGSAQYVVAINRSAEANATDITQDEIKSMVNDVVTKAGGLDFIQSGQTVVLKPNLLTTNAGVALGPLVNGVTTDWRITEAVAELVRARVGTSGKVLVMEGSTDSTGTMAAFKTLGYTTENFGTFVDSFIALEGSSCNDKSTTALVQKPSLCSTNKQMWVNKQYFEANWIISLGALKTHWQAGITGSVKNLGVGGTPVAKYSSGGCARTQNANYIDHTYQPLGQFVCDYYSMRPADFALIDGLQGIQHGPSPNYVPGGNYAKDKMNMRLIMASRNAVALDTVEALVMQCDPKLIPHLTLLESLGMGTTDPSKIDVVGNATVNDVKTPFAGPTLGGKAICSK